MRVIIFLLILCGSIMIKADSLSGKQIEQIRGKVKSLPDEVVTPEEVAVIETEYGMIVFEFFPYVAPLHAMNFKKLATAGYFVFGQVIKGMEVVDKIVQVKRNRQDRPLQDVVMKRVYVTDRSKLNLK